MHRGCLLFEDKIFGISTNYAVLFLFEVQLANVERSTMASRSRWISVVDPSI